ncbi:tyrosine-type recombinase/integrase [Pseudoalteromonas viridis]|uniref:Integrase family protein n=1 Tax=Pseudoalteromonas viridis TaxID=339617 RepID=A0ABX7V9F3_9GAMM|nr:integrase family protein [Pseudoalteromonas viridis]QTL35840.1 integrase family protein [Pseudoalteromonas viridis]
MALSVSWLDARLNKEAKETVVKADRDGLSARVSPKGKIVFQFRYRFDGKQQRVDIGTYPLMKLAEARNELDRLRAVLDQGRNPKLYLQQERAKYSANQSFESIFRDWIDSAGKQGLKEKTWHYQKRSSEIYLLPRLGKYPLTDINELSLRNCLREVSESSPSNTERLVSVLHKFYDWLIDEQILEINAAAGITAKKVGGKKGKRTRVLNDNEIRILWRYLHESKITEKNRIYIKLLLLLGGRKGELIQAEKHHFDLQSAMWTVPIEIRKQGEKIGAPIMRPLIKPAIDLIELAMQMSKSTYLFPANGQEELATNGFDTTIPNNVKIWARRSLGVEMEHWSMHDLRRTMRTRMSAITTQEVAELMIGHSKKGLDAIYNQYQYLDEMRHAYDVWYQQLEAIIEPTGFPFNWRFGQ